MHYKLDMELNRLNRIKDNSDLSPEDQEKIERLLPLNDDAEKKEEHVKDMLFIETGEDVEDIVLAWKFYKLR
jgi:hypothetical protein